MRACLLILALAACKAESPPKLEAKPEPTQPGVAIAELKPAQQIRPPQLVAVPDEQRAREQVDAEDLYQSAYMIRDRDPRTARKQFLQAAIAGSGATRAKAQNQLDAMDVVPDESVARELYLRGYQLKDGAPDEAVIFFREAQRFAPPQSELSLKIKAQLVKRMP